MIEGDGSLEKELAIDNIIGEKMEMIAPVTSPSLDFNDNEDIPTELSDSSDTHDEGKPLKAGLGNPLHLSILQHVLSQNPSSGSQSVPQTKQLRSQRREVMRAKAFTVSHEPSHPSLGGSSHVRLRDIGVPGCHHSLQFSSVTVCFILSSVQERSRPSMRT